MRQHASVESEMSNKNHCKMRTWGQQTLLSVLASPTPQTEVHYWIVLRLRDWRKNCAVSTVESWAMVLGIWAAGLGVGLTMCGALHWVRSGQSANVFHVVFSFSLSTTTSTSIKVRDTHNTHGSSTETIIYSESRGSMSCVWLVLWFKTWLSEL